MSLLQHASTLAPALVGALRTVTVGTAVSVGSKLLSRGFSSEAAGPGTPGEVVFLQNDQDVMKAVEATAEGGAAIIDFTAVWCGPCRNIAPLYETLAKENKDVMFYKVDVDNEDCRGTVQSASVTSVPMFIMIRNGEVMDRLAGADPSYLEKMITTLPPKL